ncbi:ATP-binding protein, partial [Thermococci archaeon]
VQEHLYRKFGEIYYYRDRYEIDVIADGLRVEVKAGKAHRRSPRNVVVLEKEDIPRFLIELFS